MKDNSAVRCFSHRCLHVLLGLSAALSGVTIKLVRLALSCECFSAANLCLLSPGNEWHLESATIASSAIWPQSTIVSMAFNGSRAVSDNQTHMVDGICDNQTPDNQTRPALSLSVF